MDYPLELEDRIHRQLTLGDLSGAHTAERQFVGALRDVELPPPRVLVQLLHSCLTRAEQQLADIFGDLPEAPSRTKIAEMLSRERQSDAIIDLFDQIMARVFASARAIDSAENHIPYRARVFIRAHLDHQITTGSVAHAARCSEAHLCVVFRKAYGLTVGQYIRSRRIDFAKTLLAATQLPIKSVGHRAGFGTYRTFLRTFRAQTGMGPREFRLAAGGSREAPTRRSTS